MKLDYDSFDSPIGRILIVANQGRICSLDFSGFESRFDHLLKIRYPSYQLTQSHNPGGITERVQKYFAGEFAAFDGLEVETGGTPFQQRVWTALREIPAGAVWTYAQLAEHVKSPNGFRAVGHANSLNPIGIVLPCHRVAGSDGSLTGYAGGLERKRWLLEHERARFADGRVPNLQAVLPFDGA